MNQLELTLTRLVLGLVAFVAQRFALKNEVLFASSRDHVLGPQLAALSMAIRKVAPERPQRVALAPYGYGITSKVRYLLHLIGATWALHRAKITIIDNAWLPVHITARRSGSRVVQVWHACGAFKRFGRATLEAEWGADQIFLKWVPIHANYDLTLVSSASIAPIYAEAFGQSVETISAAFGIPRTDALLPSPRRDADERAVRERLGLRDGRTTILYSPTFRGADLKGAAAPELLDIAALYRALGSEYRLIVRLHPFVKSAMRIPPEVGDFVVDASAEPDVNEVMLAGDILVSDYSSIIFEYALLNRPMAFLAPDLAAYERERGFFFDYRTGVPGPVMEETEQLARWIQAKQFDLQRVRAFAATSFDVMDGRATERFVSGVALPALRGEPIRIPPAATRQ